MTFYHLIFHNVRHMSTESPGLANDTTTKEIFNTYMANFVERFNPLKMETK